MDPTGCLSVEVFLSEGLLSHLLRVQASPWVRGGYSARPDCRQRARLEDAMALAHSVFSVTLRMRVAVSLVIQHECRPDKPASIEGNRLLKLSCRVKFAPRPLELIWVAHVLRAVGSGQRQAA